jgi:inosine-uridine nucleoside N-ribohydrolase
LHDPRPAFAIAEALRAEDLDLRAITVTFGNAPLESALRVARELVELAGADVPVAPGTAAAIPES